jgi:hypothetical protein
MLKRLQNVAVIALALLFVVGFGIEVWRASNVPHVPINQNAAEQKERAANAEGPKESTDQAIARYNKWLTIFTAILAVATVGLGFATVGLYFVSQRQLRHAEVEARRARAWRLRDDERLREQIDIARQNANAASQQARAAEAALTQLERPYLFIFGVRAIKQGAESSSFFVEYTIANYGKMPAIIEGPHIGFEISDRGAPPMPLLLFDGHSLMTSPIMQAGEQRIGIKEYVPAGMVGPDVVVHIDRINGESEVGPMFVTPGEDFDVFFRAVIQYRGPFTSGHETGAVWLYNHATYEFAVRGGEEYNYIK